MGHDDIWVVGAYDDSFGSPLPAYESTLPVDGGLGAYASTWPAGSAYGGRSDSARVLASLRERAAREALRRGLMSEECGLRAEGFEPRIG